MKPRELKTVLKAHVEARQPAIIVSEPGLGKSAIVNQIAEELGFDIEFSHPVTEDPTDPKGMPWCWSDDKGIRADFIPFGTIEKLVKAKKRTIWMIDDLGQAPLMVQAPYMQWFHARRVNGHILSDNVSILAATNRKQDKSASNGIIEALKSRSGIYNLEADLEDWCQWAYQNEILPDIIACLRANSQILCQFKPTTDLVNSPCPRSWHLLSNILKQGVPEALEYEISSGHVGEAAATSYIGFRRIANKLSGKNHPDYIIMNPEDGGIPANEGEANIQYVICTTLARKASGNTVDRIVTYADRLPEEFSVLLMKDTINFFPKATSSKTYLKWAQKHAEVLF